MNRYLVSAVLLSMFCSSASLFAQQVSVAPVSPFPLISPQWGNDKQITSTEPKGRPGAVGTPGGHAYVAVPDTAIFTDREIVLFQSTDLGETWSVYPQAISGNAIIKKCKLVRTPQDSIFLFFQRDSALACWNIATNLYSYFDTSHVVDFDVVATATGTLHLFVEEAGHHVYRYASSNGGRKWKFTGTVSDSGASPRVSSTMKGDSLIATLFTSVKMGVGQSPVTAFVYWEPVADSLRFVRRAIVTSDSTRKTEHLAVMNNGVVWVFWSGGEPGVVDVYCRVSTDGGATYGAPFAVAGAAGYDEYWIDAQPYKEGPSGVDLVYFADTVGAGMQGSSGMLLYTNAALPNPSEFFIPPDIVSEHSPTWSAAGYVPTLIEFNDTTGESGVVWVGLDGSQPKVYYDRLNAKLTAVKNGDERTPLHFALAQNYPNPFNPATTITFDLPVAGVVTLKVYSLLGQEVATLANGAFAAGRHKVQFNAQTLSSGVYFCKITIVPQSTEKPGGLFTAIRKMAVVK